MAKIKVQGLLGGSAKKISKAVGGSKSKAKPVGRFEGAGSRAGARAGAAVDRGIATAGSYANRAKSVATNAVSKVKESAGVAKAYVKKKERSAAYQVGKLVTGQSKNQNVNRRVGRISTGLGLGSAVGVGSVGAHIVNNSREGSNTKSSMGNETSQSYNSSAWSAHKKTQRGY
jgi:hypothetical protein